VGQDTRFVPTEGWEPVDSRVRVSDVAGLVAKLGGDELYGKSAAVPLRELIQNGCDAVRALRLIASKPGDWGEVRVRLWREQSEYWIEVADTGIGMSSEVLSGPLIDFGSSFWGSSLARRELPGLVSKRFEATGRYGIGFFSLFMWGDQVRVITRRFDQGPRESRVLEFMKGLKQRPILRIANDLEIRDDPGTTVQVKLRRSPFEQGGLLDRTGQKSKPRLADVCTSLCPGSPVSIHVKELHGEWRKVVSANDWLTLAPEQLLARATRASMTYRGKASNDAARLKLVDKYASNLRPLLDASGNVLGRLCISGINPPRAHDFVLSGVVTVGEFRSCDLSRVGGILAGSSIRAARDAARPIADGEALEKWATDQAVRARSISSDDEELRNGLNHQGFGRAPVRLTGRKKQSRMALDVRPEGASVYVGRVRPAAGCGILSRSKGGDRAPEGWCSGHERGASRYFAAGFA
jgi:hypothetical protein